MRKLKPREGESRPVSQPLSARAGYLLQSPWAEGAASHSMVVSSKFSSAVALSGILKTVNVYDENEMSGVFTILCSPFLSRIL